MLVLVSQRYNFALYFTAKLIPLITEYRSAIFTHSEDQLAIAKRVTEEVQAKHFTPKGENLPFLPPPS